MPMNSNQRLVHLDILRVLATFAVIFLHVSTVEFHASPFTNNWYIATVGDSLVRWCVPVFVMISGAIFLNSGKDVQIRSLFVKYIPRLLLCYVFWTIVYYFLFSYQGSFSITKLLKSHFHLWFLRMLICVYVLIPALRSLVRDNKILGYCLGVWILYMLGSFMNLYEVFKMNVIVGFSGYFLLGYYLSQPLSKKYRICIVLFGVLGAIVTILGTFFITNKYSVADERYFDNLSIQVAAMSAAVFVSVKALASKCGQVVLRFVEWVRKDLFGVYLTHALWLPLVNTETIRHCCSELFTLPIITVIVFLLSLFTTKLVRLVPGLRKVVE